jgi:hypothetical protein
MEASIPASRIRPVKEIEVYWAAAIVVVNEPGQVGDAVTLPGPDGVFDGVFDGVQDEAGVHSGSGAPADDPPGVGVMTNATWTQPDQALT